MVYLWQTSLETISCTSSIGYSHKTNFKNKLLITVQKVRRYSYADKTKLEHITNTSKVSTISPFKGLETTFVTDIFRKFIHSEICQSQMCMSLLCCNTNNNYLYIFKIPPSPHLANLRKLFSNALFSQRIFVKSFNYVSLCKVFLASICCCTKVFINSMYITLFYLHRNLCKVFDKPLCIMWKWCKNYKIQVFFTELYNK